MLHPDSVGLTFPPKGAGWEPGEAGTVSVMSDSPVEHPNVGEGVADEQTSVRQLRGTALPSGRPVTASLLLDRGMLIPMGRTMLVSGAPLGGAQTATSHLPDLGSTPELSQRYGVVVFRGLGLEPPGSRPPCSERPVAAEAMLVTAGSQYGDGWLKMMERLTIFPSRTLK